MDYQHDLMDRSAEFLREQCRDAIAKAVQSGAEGFTVPYTALYEFDPAFAEDYIDRPAYVGDHVETALDSVDLPTGDPSILEFRVSDLPDSRVHAPGELRKEHGGTYIGIRGIFDRVTQTSDVPTTLTFECQRCGQTTAVPQDVWGDGRQEPHECTGCERQGPFREAHRDSEWSDYAKIRVAPRPEIDNDDGGKVTGVVMDDVIDAGGGILDRAGEPVTVYGIARRVAKSGRSENELLYDHVLDVRAIDFERDEETVDVAAHRDTFETLADREDAVDLFAESIAPQLHATDAWDAAFQFAVAYLFGAPRIDVPKGPTYRGDLHFLIVSDYGTGKSTFKEDVEAYSPKCISKSTTALSSEVGLTAAAVKDDFGEGQWTVKPGLLVRANGGHLILDEIDKGPDELTNMNDALEGEQVVDIEKAGQSATYQSRTAVMALGNPVNGRFNRHEPIAEQIGISESLLSRFDGIVTMRDAADTEQDAAIAETYGRAYTEAQAKQYGDRDEFDTLDRPVPVDIGRAWIKHARENVNPILGYDQFEALKTWYAEEVRQLNATFAGDGEGSDMPVPATVRVLAAAVKLSIAFARVHLRDEVAPADVERAKDLSKQLVKQNWTGESFDATKNVTGRERTQQERRDAVLQAIREADGPIPLGDLSDRLSGLSRDDIEHMVGNLLDEGSIYNPEGNAYESL